MPVCLPAELIDGGIVSFSLVVSSDFVLETANVAKCKKQIKPTHQRRVLDWKISTVTSREN